MTPFDWILKNIHTLDATGGIKPFPDYPFLRRLVGNMEQHRILIVAKSRQMLATWTALAWVLYCALHNEPGIYLLISKGQRDSREMMRRLKIMAGLLPDEIRAQIKVLDEEARLENGARIIALPAAEFAPRMYSPALALWDEMAFSPNAQEVWAGVKPAVDSGGSFIGISTPNGTDNLFFELYSDAANGFGKTTLHYSESPARDESWRLEARRGLSQSRWRQEYEIDFNVLANRVYDEFDPNLHILRAPFVLPGTGRIYRGLDFGFHHPYVVWLHASDDGMLTVFAEWEGENSTLDRLIAAVREIDERLGIGESNISWSGCDPAGAASNDTGLTTVERLRRVGFKLIWKQSQILTGVDLIKSLLKDASGFVRLRFCPTVQKTIGHLRHYRWTEGAEEPVKDGVHDHALDALRYLIVNRLGGKKSTQPPPRVGGARF